MVEFFVQNINELFLKILSKYQDLDSRQKDILTQLNVGKNFEITNLPSPQNLEILLKNNLIYSKNDKFYVFVPVYLYYKLSDFLHVESPSFDFSDNDDVDLNIVNNINNTNNLVFDNQVFENEQDYEIDVENIEKYLYNKMIEELQKLRNSQENLNELSDEFYEDLIWKSDQENDVGNFEDDFEEEVENNENDEENFNNNF